MPAAFDITIEGFLVSETNYVTGALASAVASSGMATQHSRQILVWGSQVNLLQVELSKVVQAHSAAKNWHIILEYELPRRQKRPDVVILAEDVIIVIEFKFGAESYDSGGRWQVEDYAFNLRDFHAESVGRHIVPILCATNAPGRVIDVAPSFDSRIFPLLLANSRNLSECILQSFRVAHRPDAQPINPTKWIDSAYRPTLTIIEAAEQLYRNHDVREISHSYADNLESTTDLLTEVVTDAKKNGKHCICFVTGVPGAGKTLTGLNVVHDPLIRSKQGPSGIFLSGNGPLVKVVREALVQNQIQAGRRRQECEHEVSTFIQNVHSFLMHHLDHQEEAPHEHVIIFDEAQRAWDRAQMNRKRAVDASEPALILEVMERFQDWAVVVALVGGGQEIFLGEAGLEEWGRALLETKTPWTVVASPEVLTGGASVAGHKLFGERLPEKFEFREETAAHLNVSVRSYRAQRIAEWVNDLLVPDAQTASLKVHELREFPLVVTRDLDSARKWLRERSGMDPHQRCGLVASSGDHRIRAYGIEVSTGFRQNYPYEKWFLGSPDDIRSSFSLEVAATEFECQGLELDWVGVCWGGDLTLDEHDYIWEFRKFRGAEWQSCRVVEEQAYIINRYRVLLTRARLGMIIWVPPGSDDDPSRDPSRFDRIYAYLRVAGVRDLNEETI